MSLTKYKLSSLKDKHNKLEGSKEKKVVKPKKKKK